MKQQSNGPMILRSAHAGGFLRTNESFRSIVRFTEAELTQRPLIEWVVPADRELFRRALREGASRCRVGHRSKSGPPLQLELRITEHDRVPLVLGHCVNIAASDPSGGPLREATVTSTLHQIASIVEEQNPGYKCSILLVEDGRFVRGAGPSLPDDYNEAIDGFAIGPTVGSCGTAIYWNVPVIVEDIQADPLWAPFAALAKKAGVAACWSHPFVSNQGRVLGALALYAPVPQEPTAEQLSRLHAAAQMTGLAVERGRAEEELRRANEVKSVFMANMSHEIRTPLNALIGLTDSPHSAEGGITKEDVDLIRKSSEQLLALFTGILELTEGRDRRHEESQTVINIRAVCENVLTQFTAAALEKGLRVEHAIEDKVPAWLRLDQWSFERSLVLLLDNAVKFTDSGLVRFHVGLEGQTLSVNIRDSGCGINLDRLCELRQPFVQGDLSTTKKHSGFGLGLALNDLCIRALGGEIHFDNNQPRGTSVSFRFPIHKAASPTAAPPPSTIAPSKQPILVVEDNVINRRVMQMLLERLGYETHFSENGVEALEATEKTDYSCILMDCQMPVMDGYEATRRIRQRELRAGRHTPIIAVTANALAHDRARCLQAGMDEYLKKPVRIDKLQATIEQFIGLPVIAA